ncbi:hypothetical protein TNCT_178121 [Trichonephila clavata]|uniref:Uncharacterized protein n=1 Tax=Trichonephila clavata TaxID=2740835 RepID=A0A8X6G600_TRICU|nr:hypothetical protein TNCT_178121 [Trichonephila clavata]
MWQFRLSHVPRDSDHNLVTVCQRKYLRLEITFSKLLQHMCRTSGMLRSPERLHWASEAFLMMTSKNDHHANNYNITVWICLVTQILYDLSHIQLITHAIFSDAGNSFVGIVTWLPVYTKT